MPIIESIASGILVNLVYDLAKKSLILFEGDFYDQILDSFNKALKKSCYIRGRIRKKQYLPKIEIFLAKKGISERQFSPRELARTLGRSEKFANKLLKNLEFAILKNKVLNNWVRNEYSKETIDELKRMRISIEIIKELFLAKETGILEFLHIKYAEEKNIIPRCSFNKELDNWFLESNKPVMLLNGFGGAGKTVIGMEWKELIKQKPNTVKMIFVWSFYYINANFENFITTVLVNDFGKNHELVKSWDIYQRSGELINLLNKQKTLLFLDGIEKELLAYKNITDEHYDQTNIKGNRKLRRFKNPAFRSFIKEISNLENCKTLISTRVIPEGFPDNEDPDYDYEISGSEMIPVVEMEDDEIIDFVRAYNIKGTQHEILEVAKKWNNHPLALRLLVNHLIFKNKKDSTFELHINNAPSIDIFETDRLKKVLKVISENTPELERLLLMQMSAFRIYSINYPMLIIFRQNESFAEFKQVLQNLYDLGLITCSVNKNYEITDDTDVSIHPLIRHYFNEELRQSDYWIETHELLVNFFKVFLYDEYRYETIFGKMYQEIKAQEGYKVNTINDLIPVIELYHHLVGAGKFDEAFKLYHDRLSDTIYFQFSNYYGEQ